jgi:signal transduction histidine kinase
MSLRQRIWPGLRTRSIWLDAFLAVCGSITVGVSAGDLDVPEWSAPFLLVGAVLLLPALLVFRRTRPLIPFAISAFLAAIAPGVSATLLVSAYAVGRYVGRWPLRIVAATVGAVALVHPWNVNSAEDVISGLGGTALVVILPGVVGAWVRVRALLLAALRERAERAEAERELMAREAVLSERTRIAREMHDAVGHRVSLMVLQAGAIEMAAGDPAKVEQLACNVQTAGRQALDELRQMVGVLRGSDGSDDAPLGPQHGLEDLPLLVAQSRAAGMDVELHANDDEPVDPVIGRAAYRIVQEALTNGGKHAPGARVSVDVERREDELLIRVVNGAATEPAVNAAGGGFGLVGLGERVRTLGGRLKAEPRLDGGFVVEAVLPT